MKSYPRHLFSSNPNCSPQIHLRRPSSLSILPSVHQSTPNTIICLLGPGNGLPGGLLHYFQLLFLPLPMLLLW